MFNEIIEKASWGRHKITLKTGKVARQSDGAVIVNLGDTVVLCTVNCKKKVDPNITFFPLTVHYREMSFAAGKIPGGFIKREGKPSDNEVLTARLIDRPIRPLFHENFRNETQIICTVLSHDYGCNPDIAAIIGTSAALAISGLPFLEIIAAARIGYVEENLILNPTSEELKMSSLNLVLAGTNESIMMVEAEAKELSEEKMLDALKFGHDSIKLIIDLITSFKQRASKEPIQFCDKTNVELLSIIEQQFGKEINSALNILTKKDRNSELQLLETKILTEYVKDNITNSTVLDLFEKIKSNKLRAKAVQNKERIDNRKFDEIRQISNEISVLPKTHGSALFTRGETQALVTVTLGTTSDEQIVDNLEGEKREGFLLHYVFPPYSVGETTSLRPPSRREIGHGRLAWRALKYVIPSKDVFPYTIRVVSEITESNGSSSMATVCGTSLSLMDAGVPIKAAVAGIAMGLIKEDDQFVILSDILGDEDALGDMDFKVAGTTEGITALQMDIKISGINLNIIHAALQQALKGRLHILTSMSEVIDQPKQNISKYAPIIKTIKIDKDKIRDLIGPGGKVIKGIIESSGTKIEVNDHGFVSIIGFGAHNIEKAATMITEIAGELLVGEILEAIIVKIIDSGLWAKFYGNREGFVHISEISNEGKISNIYDYVTQGQTIKAKIIGLDNRGKIKLSIKDYRQE